LVVGDVINEIQDVLTTGFYTFQPAAGVEVVITTVASENADVLSFFYLSDAGILTVCLFAKGGAYNPGGALAKMGITNTFFLALHNTSAGTLQLGYSGIQTQ